ncbi:STAS/SEC14 domain-containing protein [uncultured Sphingomonas sp.]|uniref:STAS/SEC14 domain-containing protein n=1 Tax=uncultured Sphingomonas sp. TaxID=158754 RepID=UPI0025DA73DD|nr:STAS/SEC14 domain-containing protein [uncultured Sphingomonas sp.]
METPRFRVDVQVDLGLFESAIIGFWTLADVTAFAQAIGAAAKRVLDKTGKAPVSVCDYTQAGTQSKEVADALETMMRAPAVRSRRIGIVTGSMLPRIQAKRLLMERPEVRFFQMREDALAWVLAPDVA